MRALTRVAGISGARFELYSGDISLTERFGRKPYGPNPPLAFPQSLSMIGCPQSY